MLLLGYLSSLCGATLVLSTRTNKQHVVRTQKENSKAGADEVYFVQCSPEPVTDKRPGCMFDPSPFDVEHTLQPPASMGGVKLPGGDWDDLPALYDEPHQTPNQYAAPTGCKLRVPARKPYVQQPEPVKLSIAEHPLSAELGLGVKESLEALATEVSDKFNNMRTQEMEVIARFRHEAAMGSQLPEHHGRAQAAAEAEADGTFAELQQQMQETLAETVSRVTDEEAEFERDMKGKFAAMEADLKHSLHAAYVAHRGKVSEEFALREATPIGGGLCFGSLDPAFKFRPAYCMCPVAFETLPRLLPHNIWTARATGLPSGAGATEGHGVRQLASPSVLVVGANRAKLEWLGRTEMRERPGKPTAAFVEVKEARQRSLAHKGWFSKELEVNKTALKVTAASLKGLRSDLPCTLQLHSDGWFNNNPVKAPWVDKSVGLSLVSALQDRVRIARAKAGKPCGPVKEEEVLGVLKIFGVKGSDAEDAAEDRVEVLNLLDETLQNPGIVDAINAGAIEKDVLYHARLFYCVNRRFVRGRIRRLFNRAKKSKVVNLKGTFGRTQLPSCQYAGHAEKPSEEECVQLLLEQGYLVQDQPTAGVVDLTTWPGRSVEVKEGYDTTENAPTVTIELNSDKEDASGDTEAITLVGSSPARAASLHELATRLRLRAQLCRVDQVFIGNMHQMKLINGVNKLEELGIGPHRRADVHVVGVSRAAFTVFTNPLVDKKVKRSEWQEKINTFGRASPGDASSRSSWWAMIDEKVEKEEVTPHPDSQRSVCIPTEESGDGLAPNEPRVLAYRTKTGATLLPTFLKPTGAGREWRGLWSPAILGQLKAVWAAPPAYHATSAATFRGKALQMPLAGVKAIYPYSEETAVHTTEPVGMYNMDPQYLEHCFQVESVPMPEDSKVTFSRWWTPTLLSFCTSGGDPAEADGAEPPKTARTEVIGELARLAAEAVGAAPSGRPEHDRAGGLDEVSSTRQCIGAAEADRALNTCHSGSESDCVENPRNPCPVGHKCTCLGHTGIKLVLGLVASYVLANSLIAIGTALTIEGMALISAEAVNGMASSCGLVAQGGAVSHEVIWVGSFLSNAIPGPQDLATTAVLMDFLVGKPGCGCTKLRCARDYVTGGCSLKPRVEQPRQLIGNSTDTDNMPHQFHPYWFLPPAGSVCRRDTWTKRKVMSRTLQYGSYGAAAAMFTTGGLAAPYIATGAVVGAAAGVLSTTNCRVVQCQPSRGEAGVTGAARDKLDRPMVANCGSGSRAAARKGARSELAFYEAKDGDEALRDGVYNMFAKGSGVYGTSIQGDPQNWAVMGRAFDAYGGLQDYYQQAAARGRTSTAKKGLGIRTAMVPLKMAKAAVKTTTGLVGKAFDILGLVGDGAYDILVTPFADIPNMTSVNKASYRVAKAYVGGCENTRCWLDHPTGSAYDLRIQALAKKCSARLGGHQYTRMSDVSERVHFAEDSDHHEHFAEDYDLT